MQSSIFLSDQLFSNVAKMIRSQYMFIFFVDQVKIYLALLIYRKVLELLVSMIFMEAKVSLVDYVLETTQISYN